MNYDGNGYALLDTREHVLAWFAQGCPPVDDDRPSRAELAEMDAMDARARREARRG